MVTLHFTKPIPSNHSDDVEMLKLALFDRGYEVSLEDVHDAWKQHSTDRAAGWLTMDVEDMDGNISYALRYLKP